MKPYRRTPASFGDPVPPRRGAWHDRAALATPAPIRWDPSAAAALSALPESTIVATDAPWVVCMASPHRSIWLPQDQAAWAACRHALPWMTAVYLTPGLLGWSPDQRPAIWAELLHGSATHPDLGAALTFDDGSRLWLVREEGTACQR